VPGPHPPEPPWLAATEADIGSDGGADSVRLGGRPWAQGLSGDVDPGSPPGAEVMARVDGVLTQSREGLGRSPDQVVGHGRREYQCPWEVRRCDRVWRIGPESVDGGDTRTPPERRARGARWLLVWPEAGWLITPADSAGGPTGNAGHGKPRGHQGYAGWALYRGGSAGRAWLTETRLDLEPYSGEKPTYGIVGGHWRRGDGGIVTPPCNRKSTAGNPPPKVGAPVLYPTGVPRESRPYQAWQRSPLLLSR
jgi:hypothetical protein